MRLDRLNDMERYILQNGTASLDDLAAHFGVSSNTVRRDIGELLARGHITKVYGGVSAAAGKTPQQFSERAQKCAAEKQVIGKLASRLVRDRSTIFMDSGSTTVTLLPHIADRAQVTMVTHSLPAMYEASKYPNLKVIALGGMYNPTTSSYFNVSAAEFLARMSMDMVFIAATGVTLEHGLTNTTYLEAEIKRCVTASACPVVLMADHSKFGYSSLITFFDFPKLKAVVTDRLPPSDYLDVIRSNGVLLLCPETENEPLPLSL